MNNTNYSLASFMIAITCFSATAKGADADGCRDLRLFPKPDTCIIIECASKTRDTVTLQMDGEQKKSLEGASATVKYSCPATLAANQLAKDAAPLFKKNGFSLVYEDYEDPMGAIVTGKHGDRWMELFASNEDSGTVYTMTLVETGPQPQAAGEACSDLGVYVYPKGCRISECSAKHKDSVDFRVSADAQKLLQGALRSTSIACDAAVVTPAQMFDASKQGLKGAGFEIVFDERAKPDYSWMTGASKHRWVELMSFQDGDAIGYQLTALQPGGVAPGVRTASNTNKPSHGEILAGTK